MKRSLALMLRDDELKEQFLRLVSEGVTRKKACEALDLPSHRISDWVKLDSEFKEAYRHANDEQCLALADRALEIAATPAATMVEVKDKDVYLKTIQWYTAKRAPRLFAERLQHDHNAAVGVVILPALDYSQQPIPALEPGVVAKLPDTP